MDPIEAKLVKSGETCIQFSLDRSLSGVRLTILAHPAIEEFMRSMGTGELQDVRTIGRHWTPIGGVDKPFNVYTLAQNPGTMSLPNGRGFRIDRPGWPLEDKGNDPAGIAHTVTNLSFLRLQGISEGAGVTFAIKGVHTYDNLRIIRDNLMEASRQFYVTYMKPVNMSVMVLTQEISA